MRLFISCVFCRAVCAATFLFLPAVPSPAQNNEPSPSSAQAPANETPPAASQERGDPAEKMRQYLGGHKLSGYIQARYDVLFGSGDLFQDNGAGGGGQRPGISGPAVGGPSRGFLVRRGRLRFGGPLNARDEYVIQVDLSSVSSVNLRDAAVILHDLPAPGFTVRAGQFTPAFGYELVQSSRVRETPERSLAFSDSAQAMLPFKAAVSSTGGQVTPGSVLPLFLNQDRDIGADIGWASPERGGRRTRAWLGVFNGEGRESGGVGNRNNALDYVGRVETHLPVAGRNRLSLGVSGYHGALAVRSAPPLPGAASAPFRDAARRLFGADARLVTAANQELRAEYIRGRHEMTPDRALHLPGNRVSGWYVAARQPLSPQTALALKYDNFRPVADEGLVVAGVRGADFARRAVHFVVLHRLTSATRLRFAYTQGLTPYDPSAAPGSPQRSRIALLISELQVEF